MNKQQLFENNLRKYTSEMLAAHEEYLDNQTAQNLINFYKAKLKQETAFELYNNLYGISPRKIAELDQAEASTAELETLLLAFPAIIEPNQLFTRNPKKE